MPIQPVQSVTGTGNLVLNGVVAGNLLVMSHSIFRAVATGARVATPTDSNGTFVIASADAAAAFSSNDIAVGIFYEGNAASGTHTVTPESTTFRHGTLIEYSGAVTSGVFDVATSGKTELTDHTSRTTGTTASIAQADELVCIGHVLVATTGAADVGYTDPVSGFATDQRLSDDAVDIAIFHAHKIISALGTQTATFNWTAHEAGMSSMACIATFKAAAASGPTLWAQGML